MLRVRPVTADHIRLNKAGPELRDSNRNPIRPATSAPRSSPMIRAATTDEDRAALGGSGMSARLTPLQAGDGERKSLPLIILGFGAISRTY